jgi:putative FmdB family regulatory protein
MPLYEYVCRDCGHSFEVLQRMGERGEELRCPVCHEVGADRQLSTFAGHTAQAGFAGASAPGCGAGGFS